MTVVRAAGASEEVRNPYTREQLGFEPQTYNCRMDKVGQRYMAFLETYQAREKLKYYDKLLSLYLEDREKNWMLAVEINQFRGEILTHALGAYNWVGPIQFKEDYGDLLDELLAHDSEPLYLLFPPNLEQLVDVGIIPHLPASPYPNESYVNDIPVVPVQPGTVFFAAYLGDGTKVSPTGSNESIENSVLLIFDEIQYGESAEVLEVLFPGEDGGLRRALGGEIPPGIVYANGVVYIDDEVAKDASKAAQSEPNGG